MEVDHAGRATSTEQGARCATRSLTLPSARSAGEPAAAHGHERHGLGDSQLEDPLVGLTRAAEHDGIGAQRGGAHDAAERRRHVRAGPAGGRRASHDPRR